MISLVPKEVIEEVSKVEENIGYYINLGRMALNRKNHDTERYYGSVYYYDNYSVPLYAIPSNILRLLGEAWEQKLLTFSTEEKDAKAVEKYTEAFNIFTETASVILKKSTKIRKAKNLEDALELLQSLFRANLKDNGWIYREDNKNGRHYPFLVKKLQIMEDKYDGRRRWIEISMEQNSKHKTEKSVVNIEPSDLKEHKNSVVDVIRANNILFETDELKAEYDSYIQDFYDKEVTQNHQYIDNGGVQYINDNLHKKEETKGRFGGNVKLFSASTLVSHAENCPIPFNPLIYMFNLNKNTNKHSFEWVDTRDIKAYEYDEGIVEKLILPQEHKGLIDILTNDVINDNGEDIVKGKAGGTIILCRGKAGLGKTLTAEIYSELKHKPLYSIHSGQLGTNGEKVEEKLRESFERAERWGAVLLIDEADVYIRERDNDTNHNAIVASFLRAMEYYGGLLFMTTNRSNDIDDAILSRCISVLTYKHPKDDVKSKMWEIYLNQFNIEGGVKLIDDLNKEFNELSGRDIKNICRLVSRYVKGYCIEEITVDIFIQCAIFRGIKEITE